MRSDTERVLSLVRSAFDEDTRLQVPAEAAAAFLEEAGRHQLTSTLDGLVRAGRVELPGSAAAVLHGQARKQAAIAMLLETELVRLDTDFAERGIPFLLLKGASLAHSIYPSPDGRSFGDLDILIRKDRFEEVDALLCARGLRDTMRMRTSVRLRHFGTVEYEHPDRPQFKVDVHWNDVSQSWSDRSVLTHPGAWTDKAQVCILGRRIDTLGPAHRIVHLCVHAAYHHQFGRLGTLLDILLAMRSAEEECGQAAPGAVVALARSCRNLRALALCLQMARRVAPTGLEAWADEALPRPSRMVLRMAERQMAAPRPWRGRILKALSLDGAPERVRAVLTFLATRHALARNQETPQCV